MTFNGAWGWQPCPPEDWHSVRSVLNLVRAFAQWGRLELSEWRDRSAAPPPDARPS